MHQVRKRKRKTGNRSIQKKQTNHPRNECELSAHRFWAEGSDKRSSVQYLRPNLQPIYHARTFAFSAVLAVGSALRLVHLNELSTTPDNTNGEHRFTITHPFHPLCGHTFPLLSQRFAWGEERVFFPRTAILAEAITTHAVVSCLDSYITVMVYSFYDDHLRCVGRANA